MPVRTILIVDDSSEDRAACQRVLHKAYPNWIFLTAESAGEALALFNTHHPDCVLLDYDLPDGTGVRVLQEINSSIHRAPVIMLTGHGSEAVAVEAMKLNALDYMVKDVVGRYLQILPTLVAKAISESLLRRQKAQTEAELAESEMRFRLAMEYAPIGIALVSLTGQWIRVNRALCEIVGYPEQELLAKTFQDITHPDDLETDLAYVRQLLAGEIKTYQLEKRYFHKQGFAVWILLSAALVRNAKGEPQYFIAQIEDITARIELDRLKREFFAVTSHELRAPVTALRGALQLVLGGMTGGLSPEALGLLQMADKNADRLQRLLNDILDMEKIEAGGMDYVMEPLDIGALMQQAIEENQAYAQQFQVTYELQEITPIGKVNGDAFRLLQVLTNLLSNAAKFSPPGGAVFVGAQQHDGRVRVTVTDKGAGIPVEFRESVFHKFTQANSGGRHKTGSTGLGLNISKAIIERHGGTIGFTCDPARGTTFYCELPVL